MYAVDVILDWLTEHSDGFRPPEPAEQAQLLELERRGAPAALLALYRRVGKGAVGLLPCGTFDGLYPLLDPADVLELQEREGVHPDLVGSWPFAGDGDGWLVLREGAVFHVGPCGSIRVASSAEELLFRHMEGLLCGKFAWNPGRETYVPSRQLPELTRIPRAVEAVAGPGALRIWTGEILGDLVAGLPVDLSGVGKLVVSRHGPSCRLDPMTGRMQPERSHRGVARLRPDRHGVLHRRLNEECSSLVTRPVAIRGVSLDPQQGIELAAALVDAVAEVLRDERVVAWPRLGEFSVQIQPGLAGARKIVTFTQYSMLERALNLEP
jgi:hypothetical protein